MAGVTSTGTPRQIVIATFGDASAALSTEVASGVDGLNAVPAAAYAAGNSLGDTLILTAFPDEDCSDARAATQRAVEDGVLVIAVVVGGEGTSASGSTAARALRPYADILVTTTDTDLLETLARALRSPI